MQLHFTRLPPGVAHGGLGPSTAARFVPRLPSSCLGPVVTYTQPVPPPLLAPDLKRPVSIGWRPDPLLLLSFLRGTRHCSTAPKLVARQLHPPLLEAGAGSLTRGRVVSLGLRPRGLLMGQGRRGAASAQGRSAQATGCVTMSVGARTCGMAENRMLYSSATSPCLCACLSVLILGPRVL